MTILALDLAKNLGWAAGVNQGRPACGTFRLAGEVTDPGSGFAAACDVIADLITVHQPKAIVAERAVPPHRQTNADIGYWLIGLVSVAQLVAWKRDVPIRLTSAATARAVRYFRHVHSRDCPRGTDNVWVDRAAEAGTGAGVGAGGAGLGFFAADAPSERVARAATIPSAAR